MVGELTDGGVGPLVEQRTASIISSFPSSISSTHPHPRISSRVLTTSPSLYSFSHSQWLRRSLNFPHQSRASYL